jgi:hypothetical protein
MSKQRTSLSKSDKIKPASLSDLVELVLEPLAAQIDRGRVEMHEQVQKLRSAIEDSTSEILKEIQTVDDSAQILARQKARDLQQKSSGKP